MADINRLSDNIRRLYDIVQELEEDHGEWNRRFTLDGHLLGSIGEVYAAERYGLRKLFKSSYEGHDGETADGRLAQIKVTQRKAIGLASEPNHLFVLLVDAEGNFKEVYNGPGTPVWDLVKNKPMPKNGQHQISLAKLRRLDADVKDEERIEVMS